MPCMTARWSGVVSSLAVFGWLTSPLMCPAGVLELIGLSTDPLALASAVWSVSTPAIAPESSGIAAVDVAPRCTPMAAESARTHGRLHAFTAAWRAVLLLARDTAPSSLTASDGRTCSAIKLWTKYCISVQSVHQWYSTFFCQVSFLCHSKGSKCQQNIFKVSYIDYKSVNFLD